MISGVIRGRMGVDSVLLLWGLNQFLFGELGFDAGFGDSGSWELTSGFKNLGKDKGIRPRVIELEVC